MKKNYFFTKKPKLGFVAFMMVFCCLFTNIAIAQQTIPTTTATNDVLVWSGAVSSDWNNSANWYVQSRATTGVAGTSTYPGQVDLDDWAFIPQTGSFAPIIPTGQSYQIARLYVTNQFNAAGGLLTINS
jgi:hypothetical protein